METIRRSRAVSILAVLLAAVVAFTLICEEPAEARKKKRKKYRTVTVFVDQIVFASNRSIVPGDPSTTDLEIFSISPDGTGLKQLTVNAALDDGPVMSGNGAKIAYSSQEDSLEVPNTGGDREIVVMNRDGTSKSNLTNNTSIPDLTPDFSPDGSTIAYTQGDLSAADIYLVKADNTEGPRQFRATQLPEFRPVFSPDGQRIAFTTDPNPPSDFEIWDVAASDGSVHRELTINTTQDYRPAYSPDGSKIYYDSAGQGPFNGDGDFDVMVMNSNGSGHTNLTDVSLLDDLRPAVSHSGTQIVFERLQTPATGGTSPRSTPRAKVGELWIMPATGINASIGGRPLTDTGFAVINQSPDWGGYWIRVRVRR